MNLAAAMPWRRPVVVTVIVAAMAGLAIVYGMHDPAAAGSLFPKCLFHNLTGLQCPGCGSQRAIHALLNADIPAAFRFNPLLPALGALAMILALAEAFPRRFPRLHKACRSPLLHWPVATAVIIFFIVRNLPLCL